MTTSPFATIINNPLLTLLRKKPRSIMTWHSFKGTSLHHFPVVWEFSTMDIQVFLYIKHSLKSKNKFKVHRFFLRFLCWPVGRAVTRWSLILKVWGWILEPVKLNPVLPMARHRCNILSNKAVLSRRNDAEMDLQTYSTLGCHTTSIIKIFIWSYSFVSFPKTQNIDNKKRNLLETMDNEKGKHAEFWS